ncbi:unnamed protein product [Meloidogyne enterolobii]|uniref:Uncharacterized protein n=1 Tax=Meloidogyne enterolobii TaxID=390850 RepID=A0ACB0XS46_MELEN
MVRFRVRYRHHITFPNRQRYEEWRELRLVGRFDEQRPLLGINNATYFYCRFYDDGCHKKFRVIVFEDSRVEVREAGIHTHHPPGEEEQDHTQSDRDEFDDNYPRSRSVGRRSGGGYTSVTSLGAGSSGVILHGGGAGPSGRRYGNAGSQVGFHLGALNTLAKILIEWQRSSYKRIHGSDAVYKEEIIWLVNNCSYSPPRRN